MPMKEKQRVADQTAVMSEILEAQQTSKYLYRQRFDWLPG